MGLNIANNNSIKKKFSCNTQNTKHKKNDSNRQCFYVINFVVKEKIKVIINCFNYNGTNSCGELYITLESLLWVVSSPISVCMTRCINNLFIIIKLHKVIISFRHLPNIKYKKLQVTVIPTFQSVVNVWFFLQT
jgi:hypothetical protein